jgi:hypothetical protein
MKGGYRQNLTLGPLFQSLSCFVCDNSLPEVGMTCPVILWRAGRTRPWLTSLNGKPETGKHAAVIYPQPTIRFPVSHVSLPPPATRHLRPPPATRNDSPLKSPHVPGSGIQHQVQVQARLFASHFCTFARGPAAFAPLHCLLLVLHPSGPRVLELCPQQAIRFPVSACALYFTFALLHAAPPHLHLCTASLSPLSPCHRAHVPPLGALRHVSPRNNAPRYFAYASLAAR